MKTEFVPYDIALAMKELGFDEPCLGMYYNLEDGVKYTEPTWKFIIGKGLNNESEINAPLYQQAFRWFREKHGMWVTFEYDNCDCVEADVCWYVGKCFRYGIGPLFLTNELGDFKTYEEAQDACLRKLIEIV